MYFNTVSHTVTAAPAATSFTTDFTINNFDCGAVQIIWSGIDSVASTFLLQASLDDTNYDAISLASTLTVGSSNHIVNMTNSGYSSVRCVYAAATATTGSIDIWIAKKSHR